MKYVVTWVGDRPRDWGEDRRTYTIGVADESNTEYRNVKLDQDQDDPAPAVGDNLEGEVKQHPRFADARILEVGSPAQIAENAQRAETRDANISRSVAFKGAVALAAAGKIEVKEIELYTEALLKAVTGEVAEEGDGIPF